MQPGKLPADLLRSLLGSIEHRDPSVVIGPGIGRDAAVIDTGGPRLLVAKTDPITFATSDIGWYAVHVNANDIACMGARPQWFLATVLLPEGAHGKLASAIFDQIAGACQTLGVVLIGGHTEITQGLDRPVVSGAMLGEVERDRLVRSDGARDGDALILTKGIAIEGTAVLAREAGSRLKALGVSARALATARRYLTKPGISIVADATTAGRAAGLHAMHDPTEGGLATALYEMAEASRLGIVVDEAAIEVLPATRDICTTAGLDPFGLLASGALLIAASDGDAPALLTALRNASLSAARIGTFTSARRVIMRRNGQRRPVPRFARDEVARFFSEG